MSVVKYYRVYCNTESAYAYVWGTTEPTVCPNNNSHSINATATSILNTNSEAAVTIKQEEQPTGGHYQSLCATVSTVGNDTVTTTISFPYPVNALAVQFHTENNMSGDSLSLFVGQNTTIGVLTNNVAISDTVLSVSPTALQYLHVGRVVTLDDGVNTDSLGRCLSLDLANGQITVELGAHHAFSSATPTYIKMTAVFFKDMMLVGGKSYTLGATTLGSSYIPTGVPIQIMYTNNTADPKKFYGIVEYLY